MADKKVTRELAIFINDRQVTNSLAGVTREIGKVNAQMRNLNKSSETYDEDLKRLQKDLEILRDRQADFKNEIYATNEAGLEATEIFSKIFIGLTSGNLEMAKEGINGIKGSVNGLVASARAFIATPIGAAIAVLSGIVVAGKALFDYNIELEKTNKQLKALGVNADEISKVRSEIAATAETFDKEFSEIAERANSLAKSFGISMSEANAVIAEGLANGGAQNQEFLDSLGEYDEFFSKAGFSAREFINVVNTGFELGIYTDKLPDALKEADLSLKEQTKASRDALVNAFGATFADDILNKVRTGEMTTKQALEAIAAQAEKTQLSQQQQAQLTADIFRGAGEDAGGALKIFQAVGQAATKELSETAKASLELVEANERLNKAQADLFEIKGFGDLWTGIKAAAIDTLADIIEYIADLKRDTQPLIDLIGITLVIAWENVKATASTIFTFLGGAFKVLSNTIGTFVNFFKKIFQGDFRGALNAVKDGFVNLGNIIKNTFGSIYNTIVSGFQGIVKAIRPVLEAVGIDVDKLQKKLESFKVKVDSKRPDDKEETKASEQRIVQNKIEQERIAQAKEEARKKEAEARAKAAQQEKADRDKALKEEEDRLRKLQEMYAAVAEAKIRLAKAELNAFLANNKTLLDNNKLITDELLQAEIDRLNAVNQKRQDELLNETNREFDKATRTAKSQEELNALLTAIDIEFQTKRAELDNQTTDAILNARLMKEQQDKAIRAEQLRADKEIELGNAKNEFDAQQIRLQQQYETELASLVERKQKQNMTEQQFAELSKQLEERTAEARIRIARAERDAKIMAYGDMFGSIAQLLGENTAAGKAAAIAQVGISQGLAIARIWEAKDTLPSPFNTITKVAQTALAVGNVISALKQINSVKVPTAKPVKFISKSGFFDGGFTGTTANLGYDQYGAVTGVVHEDEWVAPKWMKNSPRYARTISWLEKERQRTMRRGFAEGGNTSPTSVPQANAVGEMSSARLEAILDRLSGLIEAGIRAKVFIGYEDAQAIQDLLLEKNDSQNNGTLNEQ